MCPTLGACIVIYIDESIKLHIKHANKMCPSQVTWARIQHTSPCWKNLYLDFRPSCLIKEPCFRWFDQISKYSHCTNDLLLIDYAYMMNLCASGLA